MNNANIVFFQGNTQYKNTGDVLINKSLLDHLRKKAKVIVNDVSMPKDYVTGLGLMEDEKISNISSSFGNLLLTSSIKAAFGLGGRKVYLIAGPPGHLFGNSRKKNIRNILSGIFFFFLRVFHVKIIKIGFSLGPIGKELGLTEKFRAIPTQYYLVRDSLSLSLAHKIGIKKAKFFPDLAWTYEALPYTNKEKKKIILSFRDAVVTGVTNDKYLIALKKCLVAMLKSLDENYDIEVTYQVAMDYDFCKQLHKELLVDFSVSFEEKQITLATAPEKYNDAICIITNRLHGALLGYKYHALPIVLTDVNDHLKIKGIYNDAGIENLLLSTRDLPEVNSIKFQTLISQRVRIMEGIKNVEERYSILSKDILKKIFK